MNRFYDFDKAMTAQICPPQELPKLEVYFGCSRWTNANKNHAGHIANEGGQPLCGKNYKNGASERIELTQETSNQVTCARCKKLVAFDLKFGDQ